MKPAPFDYERPNDLDQCLALLARHGDEARMIAGGQSLMPMLALRLARPGVVVDLNRIEALNGIDVQSAHLRIGAMTRQAKILDSADVARMAPLLVQALDNVGHPPTRARGTIGGSLCHADPAAELPVAMIALDATMMVSGPGGERRVSANDFFVSAFQTALTPQEMLLAIEIPRQTGSSGFFEVSPRRGDFAIASAAARIVVGADDICSGCSVVIGGVAERPVNCVETAKRLTGSRIDGPAIARAVAALPFDAITMDSRLASAAYRRRVLPVVVRRAIDAALTSRKAGAR